MAALYAMPPFSPKSAYMPSTPAAVPKAVQDYAKSLLAVPLQALQTVAPLRLTRSAPHYGSRRRSERVQVGHTNRWRLPESLHTDLLGLNQATKATTTCAPYNDSYVRVLTAEGRHASLNKDSPEAGPSFYGQNRDETTLAVNESGIQQNDGDTRSKSCSGAATSRSKMSSLSNYVPSRARPATPQDLLVYHSTQNPVHKNAPDVLLKCRGVDWELHRPVLQKASVLSQLVTATEHPVSDVEYYKTEFNRTLDAFVRSSHVFANETDDTSCLQLHPSVPVRSQHSNTNPNGESKRGQVVKLQLDVSDNLVTPEAMAVALGNLYCEKFDVPLHDLAGVFAAACIIGFEPLVEYCGSLMLQNLSTAVISKYYAAATRYKKKDVLQACERWLELNLVPQMSVSIQLRDISMEFLCTVLKSSRLFTFSEYYLFKTLCHWLFLQLNPQIQLMPTHANVLYYFNSLPKQCALLESEDGQAFASAFYSLRLHGILDTAHLQELRQMNIYSQQTVASVLAEHYQSLQGGGDMSLSRNFLAQAVRRGFIIEKELPYHSELFSLHGFHFEIKCVQKEKEYEIYMVRLKPSDPVLSFQHCERQTFSMRPDRDVRYCITAQSIEDGKQCIRTTGILMHRFGLSGKTSRSESLKPGLMPLPMYVTFSILFPQS